MMIIKCGSSILLKRNSNIYIATVSNSTVGCGMIKDYWCTDSSIIVLQKNGIDRTNWDCFNTSAGITRLTWTFRSSFKMTLCCLKMTGSNYPVAECDVLPKAFLN